MFKSKKDEKETLCIKVPKVYDWVTRQADVPLQSFTGHEALKTLKFKCNGADCVDPCAELAEMGKLSIECILTDAHGNPVNPLAPGAIICKEITQPHGRQDVNITLPDGEVLTLQRVKVLKKGYYILQIRNASGTVVCTSAPQSFAVAEKFFLCAPEGTFLQCEITDFECDVNLICEEDEEGDPTFQQIDVSINMCQNIQMEAIVKLEIEAEFCQPRSEVPFTCPPLQFPPQCPEIFPVPDDY
ncbi:hypothetical protein [Alkalihalobacterium chitinilyticum]|uniref:Uncharacterized protein n=1 Tax=Alkalihalobacterium chitinilyticum TaxID=2980103 RepID=A0ABT5VB66_9BACI|nr:hypothetical protein [Alkalihalobacterium chitinilyticum]MDE5412685.1 hypothetical protein [Alkalihalobacterium chitinilyticum]